MSIRDTIAVQADQKRIDRHMRRYQQNIREAFEVDVLVGSLNVPSIVGMMYQVVEDVGQENAASILEDVAQGIRDGKLGGYTGRSGTKYEEIGFSNPFEFMHGLMRAMQPSKGGGKRKGRSR